MPPISVAIQNFARSTRDGWLRVVSLGGLGWKELAGQVGTRVLRDDVFGRSAQLSYYFLMAIFPLLIFLSAVLGYVFASQEDSYSRLLFYLQNLMPPSAFGLLSDTLNEITQEAGGGKLTLGLLLTLWIASSGMEAIIEALNAAYGVKEMRPWWRRRLVALGLTISLGFLVAFALLLIVGGGMLSAGVGSYFPIVNRIARLSTVVQWIIVIFFLLLALSLVFRFAPNLRQPRIEANLPGAVLSLACWLGASAGLKAYLSRFGTFHRTYGSLAAVIILLLWLYASGAAILIGGELNSVIWRAVVRRRKLDGSRKRL